MPAKKSTKTKNGNGATLDFESQLWAAASHWVNGFTSHPLPSHLAKNLTEDYVSMRSYVNVEGEVEEE